MAFPAYRLPSDVEEGAQGGPEFATVIQESVSGQEQRVKVWAKCRARYDIAYSVLNSEDPIGSYKAVLALFYAHNGRFKPFRFKDWGDFQATDTLFAVTDGSINYQLSKTYDPSQLLLGTPGSVTYTREIYLLSTTPVIKQNNVILSTPADYTISSTGLVTLTSDLLADAHLTWSGEFDIPVRFDTDRLPVTMNVNSIANIDSISLREVIGSAELG